MLPAPKFITGALSTKTEPDATETWRYPLVIESCPSVARIPIPTMAPVKDKQRSTLIRSLSRMTPKTVAKTG
jgi:hypothetical protein